MADAFISYSRKNKDFVQSLNQALINRHNKDAWIDWEDIKPGTYFWDEIKAGIAHADSFISIVSPDSMESVMCHLEINHAIKLKKRIVPIIFIDVDDDGIKSAFDRVEAIKLDKAMIDRLDGKNSRLMAEDNWRQISHINWIFFRELDNFETSLEQLIEAVERDIEYVKAHTRYLILAQEWERKNQRGDLLLFGEEIDLAEAWLKKAETYSHEAKAEKIEVLYPIPGDSHNNLIRASRKAQNFRSKVRFATVLSIIALIAIAIFASITISNTQQNLDALNQELVKSSEILNDQFVYISPRISDSETARAFCTVGILLSEINRDAVITVCDQAVELATPILKSFYKDFRGIERAQAGDLEGALKDFQFAQLYYKTWAKNCVEVIDLRTQWISDLEQGINPFNDSSTLDNWLHEPSLIECDTS